MEVGGELGVEGREGEVEEPARRVHLLEFRVGFGVEGLGLRV